MKPKPHIVITTFTIFFSIIAILFALGYGDTKNFSNISRINILILLITISTLLMLLSHSIASIIAYIFNKKLILQHQNYITNPIHPFAVLLCTRDDWISEAGERCLDAMRLEDHLFICDDSESVEFKAIVTNFSKKHNKRCTLVRRDNLRGWKAGNLNNCLSVVPASYKYFIIVDHDNIISRDILQKADSSLSSDPNLAFIQFRSRLNDIVSTKFSENLSSTIEAIWILLSVRMIYGFRFNVGHVVAFNRDAVLKVNGFPEKILTEDIAITIKLLAAGFKTDYCMSIAGSESVPGSYARYRARYCRWCIGTMQSWISRDAWKLIKNCNLHISLDGIFLAGNLLYPFPVAILLIVFSIASPIVSFPPNDGGFTLKLLTLFSLIFPNFPMIMAQKNLFNVVRYVPIQMAIYLSLIVPVVVSVLSAFIFNQFTFQNTGNKNKKRPKQNIFSPNGVGTIMIEIAIAAFLLIKIWTIGPFGIIFLSGILAGIAFMLFDWSSHILDGVKYFPFAVFLASILAIFSH